MATKKNTENNQVIAIKPVELETAEIAIIGETPLIVHAWSEKAKREMLESQQKTKKDKKAKAVRDPFAEFVNAAYWITEKPEDDTEDAFNQAVASGAKFGFPIIAIKQAALSACYRAGIIPNQTGMKCSFFLNAVGGANTDAGLELGVIETPEPPILREDMVKIGGISKTADLRYRPEYRNWFMRLKVTLIKTGVFRMVDIINGINLAGQMNGIGEWRMERDGDFGRFHVASDDEMKRLGII